MVPTALSSAAGGAFTLDVRVKCLETVTQGNGKSMSIVDSTGNGRGIKLRTDGMELVNGSGVVSRLRLRSDPMADSPLFAEL